MKQLKDKPNKLRLVLGLIPRNFIIIGIVASFFVVGILFSNEPSILRDSVTSLIEKTKEVVGVKEDEYIFLSGSIDPMKVAPGDEVTVTVEIKDNYGIEKVTADMGGIATIELKLIEGTIKQGIWQGIWIAFDTEPKNYQTTVLAVNVLGKQGTMTLNWEDPTITDSFDNEDYVDSKVDIVVDTTAGQVELDSYTKLLLHLNGPDNSVDDADFIDSSLSSHTVSQEGGARLTNYYRQFDAGSAYFDGDEYVTVSSSSDFNFGTNIPFTIDAWIRPSHLSGQQYIFDIRGNHGDYMSLRLLDNKFSVAKGVEIDGTITLYTNSWVHVALVSDGSTATIYVNGVADGQDESINQAGGDAYSVTLGCYRTTTQSTGLFFTGYIDELRVSKGIARWTSNFRPPTREYPPDYKSSGTFTSNNLLSGQTVSGIDTFGYNASSMIPGTYLKTQFSEDDSNWEDSAGTPNAWDIQAEGSDSIDISGLGYSSANFYYKNQFESTQEDTKLLLHFDGSDDYTKYIDSSIGSSFRVYGYGTDQIDTAQSKFGGSSLLLDGDSDYLRVSHEDTLNLNSAITISAWVNPDGFAHGGGGTAPTLISKGSQNYRIAFDPNSTPAGKFWIRFSGFDDLISISAVPTNDTWSHIAVTFGDGGFKLYFNGELDNSDSQTGSLTTNSDDYHIGAHEAGNFFDGHIDELRILDVVLTAEQIEADYNATRGMFVSQDGDDTVLMLHLDGRDGYTRTTDISSSAHDITFNDNVEIDTAQSKFGGASAYFDGTGDFLTVPNSADWDFGTGDFTIDCWIRLASVDSRYSIIDVG